MFTLIKLIGLPILALYLGVKFDAWTATWGTFVAWFAIELLQRVFKTALLILIVLAVFYFGISGMVNGLDVLLVQPTKG